MHCTSCQYDLAGLEAGACPECGRRFDPGDPATFGIPGFEHRRRRVMIGVAAAGLLAVMTIGFSVTKDTGVAMFLPDGGRAGPPRILRLAFRGCAIRCPRCSWAFP